MILWEVELVGVDLVGVDIVGGDFVGGPRWLTYVPQFYVCSHISDKACLSQYLRLELQISTVYPGLSNNHESFSV